MDVLMEIAILVIVLILTRVLYLVHKITTGHSRKATSKRTVPCKTMICIGSGGHTTEMLILLKSLNLKKYSPRRYIIAKTDATSRRRVEEFEKSTNDPNYRITEIPRSREVNQSYITSMFTTGYSILMSIPIVVRDIPDLILCNGPGICIPICLTSFLLKITFIADTRIVFVESFCRVETFSLSAKILKYVADNFLVQWPELAKKMKRAEYIGRLM